MRVLLTGAGGQVGLELQRTVPAGVALVACRHVDLDVCDRHAVERTVGAVEPDVIVNGAAYTAVDRAESEQELAFRVNSAAAQYLATAARTVQARMIHLSTDFVFDGLQGRPYATDAPAAPLNVYGQSKLEGERHVQAALGASATIVRTAWVYSALGANFVKTMLRLMSTRETVSVVSDQVGTPTWGRSVAEAIWKLVQRPDIDGIVHWTDEGVASWYDFAVAIQEEALSRGMLSQAAHVQAIGTAQYPAPARRPAYSVLEKSRLVEALGVQPPHWRVNLRSMLNELVAA